MREAPPRDLAEVTAAVLVGGLGTRLRSVVADRPKVLADVHGRPFVAYLLDALVDAGVRDVVLCTGYLAGDVKRTLGDTWNGARLSYSEETAPLGTGGALRLATPRMRSSVVLVANGDSFCETDLPGFFARHVTRCAAASILLAHVPSTERYGRVTFDHVTGRVVSFQEKGIAGEGLINAGVYLVDRARIAAIPEGRAVSLERDVLSTWIGGDFYGDPSGGRFLDVGTPESYAGAGEFFGGAP